MELKFQVFAKIAKPVEEVFDAVYSPGKLSSYFTTGGASAPLDEGATVTWDFADYPGAFPVHIKEVVKNEKIVLEWQAYKRDYNTIAVLTFEAIDASSTLVRVSESGWENEQEDLDSSYMNCMGWSQMLCHMKTWVEHGINLREFFY